MENLHLARPDVLIWLLAVLPATIAFWYFGFRMRKAARDRFGEERLVNRNTKPLTLKSEFFVLAGWLSVVGLLVFAAAGPVAPAAPTTAQSGTLQVIAVTDVSQSMRAEDYRGSMPPKDGLAPALVPGPYGTRLDMVKIVIQKEILPAVQGNEFEIVLYMGNSVAFPDFPTDDFQTLDWIFRNWVRVGNAPGGGSDFVEGLKEAVASFKRSPNQNMERVIVLFSDGGYTGSPEELQKVIEEIRQLNARLIIVGVGTPENVPIPEYSPSGEMTGYKKLKEGQTTALKEENLTALQNAVGPKAEYIRLAADADLNINWARTLAGSKTEQRENPLDGYVVLLATAILLVLSLRGSTSGLFASRKRSK